MLLLFVLFLLLLLLSLLLLLLFSRHCYVLTILEIRIAVALATF